MPLSHLSGFQNFVILHTANGYTYVHFQAIATPVVRVTANGAGGVVTVSQGAPSTSAWASTPARQASSTRPRCTSA